MPRKQNSKIGRWATEEGAAQPVAKGGGAGALQERELGAVGLRQDVRASVFTENCKVQVAQRRTGRRNTLQVGAGKAGSRIRRKGATGGLEAGWQAGRHQQLAAEHKAGVGQVKVAPHGLASSPLKGCWGKWHRGSSQGSERGKHAKICDENISPNLHGSCLWIIGTTFLSTYKQAVPCLMICYPMTTQIQEA